MICNDDDGDDQVCSRIVTKKESDDDQARTTHTNAGEGVESDDPTPDYNKNHQGPAQTKGTTIGPVPLTVPVKNHKNKMTKNNNVGSNNSPYTSSGICSLNTQFDLDKVLGQMGVILEFVTTWCGACKGIQPLVEQLASLHRGATTTSSDDTHDDSTPMACCLQVICDKNKETKKLAAAYGVTSYPVFIVFDEADHQLQGWDGANQGKLEKAFESVVSGGGGGGGGGRRKGAGKIKGKGKRR